MKTPFFTPHPVITIILFSLFFISCKKQDSNANTFVWTFKSKNYSASWDNAYLSSRSPTPIIVAGIGANINPNIRVSISLTSFNPGTYTFGSGGNSFYYIDDNGNNLNTISGTTTITANTNNRLSGTFNATLADISGSQNLVSGSFTNVVVSQ
jgi:hypothetical protein